MNYALYALKDFVIIIWVLRKPCFWHYMQGFENTLFLKHNWHSKDCLFNSYLRFIFFTTFLPFYWLVLKIYLKLWWHVLLNIYCILIYKFIYSKMIWNTCAVHKNNKHSKCISKAWDLFWKQTLLKVNPKTKVFIRIDR